ncbi:MAG: helix-turn-helix domain-containing protein [Deltaproteobacteria bacterium]|nr:helix-turn-helix domain-containing protein [Deltaproteobacteria bacterium]
MDSTHFTEPNEKLSAAAALAARALAPVLSKRGVRGKFVKLRAQGERQAEVTVPSEAFELFVSLLAELANGNAVTLVPVHAELTTQQAAEILNVSRPHLVKLLDEKVIPHRLVGTRRRVLFRDLMAYKQVDDAERKKLADELTAEAQKLGFDY